MTEEEKQQQNSEQSGVTQVQIFEALQKILLDNLDINRQNTDAIKDSVSIAKELEAPFNLTDEAAKRINKTTRDLSSLGATINSQIEERSNFQNTSASIEKDILKNTHLAANLANEKFEVDKKGALAAASGNEDAARALADISLGMEAQLSQAGDIDNALQKELEHRKNIENAVGLTGQSLGIINKLTGGHLTDLSAIKTATEERLAKMEKEGTLQDGLTGKMQGFGIQVHEIGKAIAKNMTDPLVILQQLMNFSNQTRDLQRGLGISKDEAEGFRHNITLAAAGSEDLLATSVGLLEANQQLNSVRGTGVKFTEQQLLDTNRLLKASVLTTEAAGELSKIANVTGQGIREAYLNQIDGVLAAEQESGVRLDIKSTLEATNKISGQVRAQLGANPKALGEAVAQAKALGMELSDVAAAGKAILNFESSIEAELEAELLTGKSLNLEKARLAALTGDYETLTREINKNVGDFGDFTSMNVLQQDALAASLGMSTDALSDQLLKKADLNALASEARAEGKEDVATQLEALSASDKMNASVEKLKGVFGDILGILTPIIDMVASLAGYIAESSLAASILGTVMATFAVKSIIGAVSSIFQTFSMVPFGLGIPLAIGTTALLYNQIQKAKSQKMAEGGIVEPTPGGTLTTIGEAGETEAVIPLSKANEMGFGAPSIIPINNTNTSSGINKDDLVSALRTVEKEKPKQPVIIRENDSNYSNSSPLKSGGNKYSIKYETSFS